MKLLLESWRKYLTLNESQAAPELSFENDRVILTTHGGGAYSDESQEWGMSVEEFLNMKTPEWDPDVVEIETVDMGGKSIDIPKEMWAKAAEKLKGA